jgi:hypothetical protein
MRAFFRGVHITTSADDVAHIHHLSGMRSVVTGDLLNESGEVIRFDEFYDRLDIGALYGLALAEQIIILNR